MLSDLELRSITGHESQKNFEGYIRIGISEQAQRVGDKIKAAREARTVNNDTASTFRIYKRQKMDTK